MYWLYSSLLALTLVLGLPYWLYQMVRHGKYRVGLLERLGRVPPRLLGKDSRPVIWIHAVSVGEVFAISRLAQELGERFPEYRLMISTTTDTGQNLARKRFGEENVFYFPLDLTFAIKPYLRRLQPKMIVVAETELWPNFLRLARKQGVSVAVVNARISDRSLPGYYRARRLLAPVLRNIDLFLAQTEEDKNRLVQIGASTERVRVSGNLKFDIPVPEPPPIVASLRRAFKQAGSGPILVCGSTVQGEEPPLLQAFRNVLASFPQAVMVLAPRHPERFGEVAQLLEKSGGRFWRRSLWEGDAIAGGVLLADSIGELASLYSLADIAFVGGSLVPRGGHNILEPAQHGVPIVVGNHTENFRDIVGLFQAQDTVRVVEPADLTSVFMELLSNNAERAALGRRALETLHAQQGSTQKTLDALTELLKAQTPAVAARNE